MIKKINHFLGILIRWNHFQVFNMFFLSWKIIFSRNHSTRGKSENLIFHSLEQVLIFFSKNTHSTKYSFFYLFNPFVYFQLSTLLNLNRRSIWNTSQPLFHLYQTIVPLHLTPLLPFLKQLFRLFQGNAIFFFKR